MPARSHKNTNVMEETIFRQKDGGGSLQSLSAQGLDENVMVSGYRTMLVSRMLDEKTMVLLRQGKAFFHIGGSGHEAAQVATALAMKPGYDWAYPYYRDVAFSLQYGSTPEDIFLENMHRAEGKSSGGRQMPAHYGDKDLRIVPQSSPTGTQFLQAVGTAMGAVKDGSDEVVYVSSGEGTTSQGEFHEAVNWASRELLPVIFLIQDNRYAISVTRREQTAGELVYEMVKGYKGLNRYFIDGTDFFESYRVAREAVENARTGEGPSLIHADLVRLLPHSSSDDHKKYRDAKELEQDKKRDPIPLMERFLIEQGILTEKKIEEIRRETKKRIDEAADWAEARPLPETETSQLHVFASERIVKKEDFREPSTAGRGKPIVLVDAVNHALAEEMERNPKMLIYGEDVAGKKGGVFTATKGLTDRFGYERVFNSPLAEASIVGTAFGLAVRGFKPVVEIQFGDYIWPAFMQIRNEVSMFRYRTNGNFSCPVVIRVATGGYIRGGLYHSQSIEAFFTHIPGLYVVYPSNAADAKGLLKTACREEDPVMFLEHKGMYRQGFAAAPEPDGDFLMPFGVAGVKQEGEDITVVTYGMMVHRAIAAAKKLENASVEIIDLRTLVPLDEETIYRSVRKTGKVLVVHEDTLTGGFGGEIAARIGDVCFQHLDGPVKRVAAKDSPVPYSPPLEKDVLPGESDILDALRELAAF
jgi:2-oxoisovalerate dehydrogenase E1 component